MSDVVVVKYAGEISLDGLDSRAYKVLLDAAMGELLAGEKAPRALRRLLPSGIIGMKTNCLVGKLNSTPPALVDAMTELLMEAEFDVNDVVIWERTNRELSEAGYELNASVRGRRCLGTDAAGLGYGRDFYNSGNVDSLITRILTDLVDFNVNLPVLKDHSIAGLSAGLKNMYGAINNPNKYHGNNCNPACAHVYNLEPIRKKNRLTIIDAVKVQYNGGPGYVGTFLSHYNGIIMSDDPVAADRVGLEILEHIRAGNGQPPLDKVGRPANYLISAEQLGLGLADLDRIDIRVVLIDESGDQKPGELF